MGKVSNPYSFNIKQNYISYAELGKELVDLSYYCQNNIEKSYQITELPQEHIEYLNSVRPNNIEGLFSYCSKLISLDLSNFNTSNVADMSNMFEMCADKIIGLSNWNTSKVVDMSYMFANYENTIHISDLSNWDVSNVTDMSNMFASCDIAEDELDLSNWDTSKVTDMGSMFYYSSGFYYIKGAIDMSSVRSCFWMFYKSSLKSVHLKNVPRSLDLSNIGDVSYIVDNYID